MSKKDDLKELDKIIDEYNEKEAKILNKSRVKEKWVEKNLTD